jgi:hypothetical protein
MIQGISDNVEFGHTIVQKVYHPYVQPDGSVFAGKLWAGAGNTKGGNITVPLTSCLNGLD